MVERHEAVDPILGSFGLPGADGAFWFDKIVEEVVEQEMGQAGSTTPGGMALDDMEPGTSDPDAQAPSEDAPPAQHRRRGRGRAKSNLSAEERRLKNREIQARYRSKQKTMREELETTHSQIADDLEKLRGENAVAKEQNALLEKMLAVRDASIHILKRQGSEANASTVSSEERNNSKRAVGIGEEPSSEGTGASSGNSGSGGSSVPRPIVHSMYQTFSTDLGAPVQSIADAYYAAANLQKESDDNLALKYPQYTELIAAVKSMTGHQLVQGWREFTLLLKGILEEHEQDLTNGVPASSLHWKWGNPPEVLAKIQPLFEEQVVILSIALRHNLPAVQALFDTAGDVGPDPVTYWRKVAEAMDVTQQQREKLVALWRGYSSRVAALRSQRHEVVQSLSYAANAVQNGSCPVESLHIMMERYCTLFDKSGKLAVTPDSELLALLELMQQTGQVWTMLQRAKMVAMAYPSFPDTVHFVRVIAEMEPSELSTKDHPPATEEERKFQGMVERSWAETVPILLSNQQTSEKSSSEGQVGAAAAVGGRNESVVENIH